MNCVFDFSFKVKIITVFLIKLDFFKKNFVDFFALKNLGEVNKM